jgi:hypothetical protein
MVYFFFRILFIPLAYVGWLIYELAIKRKKWALIQGDALVGGFFVLIATIIYFYLSQ